MLTEYARVGMKLVEAYPTYILLETQSHHLSWLQDKGILFLEEKDINIIRFNDHLLYSQIDKNIQVPAYLLDDLSLSMDSALFLLQWIGPEKVEWRESVEAYDIDLLFPLHQYGWICKATSGTVAGTGASSANRQQKGIAYNARLVSQNFLGNQSYYNTLGGLYALLQEAYNAGVRTHNNSWGYNWSSYYHVYGAGEYTSGTRDIDRFLWDHMDFTMVKSAGNNRSSNFNMFYYNYYGPYPFARGTRTITADSNAKNLICVGALENENGTPVGHPSSWGKAESKQRNIAWFSSTGPTHDGRIKPDIVAPGDPLLSVNRNHLSSPYSLYTSMSGPVVTGSAVLVRQFYRDYHQLNSNEVSSALVKATLAWTDYADSLVPPNAASSAFNQKDLINNLHLEILDMNNMTNYRGNQMKNGFSLANPNDFDHINNVEQIVLPGTNDSIYHWCQAVQFVQRC